MESRLGPGASEGGAGGPRRSGVGAGDCALCFLPFFFLLLDGAGAGVEEAGAGLVATGVGASGAGEGGD